MKAADFQYERPSTLSQALEVMADPEADAAALAGGQSLMPMMNFRLAQPGTLVDLSALTELKGILLQDDGYLRIGAMTRYCELAQSDVVADRAPLIGMALPHIAHSAVRNRGTIGGSVALADPAAEMPALLLAMDATVCVQSSTGEARYPAQEFFLGMYETALSEGELVTTILIPPQAAGRRYGFYELARRHGDYAMAGVAVSCPGTPGDDPGHRVAFFSISDRALRASGAEAALDAGEPVDQAVTALADLPFSGDLNAGTQTKRHLAGVVLRRALEGI